MQLKKLEDLLFTRIDVLQEIGNIGMGNAATALSQMLGNKVDMSIPDVRFMNLEQSAEYLDKLQETSLGIILTLSGETSGMIIHVLRKSFAEKIINFFFPTSIDSIENLDEMSMSVISEVGNITSAAYVNAIAAMTGIFIDISTPTPCKSLSEAVTSAAKTANFLIDEKIMFVSNSFFFDNEEIKSNLIFLPEIDSLKLIFEKMGIDFGKEE